MNRDEILSKSRIDNRGGDERERKITEESGVWGAVAMVMAVAAVFMVRVLTKGGPMRPSCYPIHVPCCRECLYMEQDQIKQDAFGGRAVRCVCYRVAVRLRGYGLMPA